MRPARLERGALSHSFAMIERRTATKDGGWRLMNHRSPQRCVLVETGARRIREKADSCWLGLFMDRVHDDRRQPLNGSCNHPLPSAAHLVTRRVSGRITVRSSFTLRVRGLGCMKSRRAAGDDVDRTAVSSRRIPSYADQCPASASTPPYNPSRCSKPTACVCPEAPWFPETRILRATGEPVTWIVGFRSPTRRIREARN